jgi:hypothetical protein
MKGGFNKGSGKTQRPSDFGNDHRSNHNAGILITDFTITSTETTGTTELARIASDLTSTQTADRLASSCMCAGNRIWRRSESLASGIRFSFRNRRELVIL